MKYKTFARARNSVLVSTVLLGGGGILLANRGGDAPAVVEEETSQPAQPLAAQPPAAAVPTVPVALTAGPDVPSALDREILDLQTQPLSSGTGTGSALKWRIKRTPLVIELRSDADKDPTKWNRVKVDLDGDKSFDQVWEWKLDGRIKRRTAPADDENYTVTDYLRGDRWVVQQ